MLDGDGVEDDKNAVIPLESLEDSQYIKVMHALEVIPDPEELEHIDQKQFDAKIKEWAENEIQALPIS